MTTSKMINKISKEVTNKSEACTMWQRILKGYQTGKIGSIVATDLGMYLERVWGKEVIK
jgi:hypothetical protein